MHVNPGTGGRRFFADTVEGLTMSVCIFSQIRWKILLFSHVRWNVQERG